MPRPPCNSPDELFAWLRRRGDCDFEDGLNAAELARAETTFEITMPPLWRAVLSLVHPVPLPAPRHDEDDDRYTTLYPDWRLRNHDETQQIIEAPIQGILFDVEQNGFWWHAWGDSPAQMPQRLQVAREHLSAVPRLTPLWDNWYVADRDDSPVFDIMQTDLYVQSLTLASLAAGASQDGVPADEYPIGQVPFWSDLHAYSRFDELGPLSRFAHHAQDRPSQSMVLSDAFPSRGTTSSTPEGDTSPSGR